MTYFTHAGSVWVKPILFGGSAWIITFCSILSVRLMGRVPKKTDPITLDNVALRIREWFDAFGLTVKTVHDPESSFGYVVTTDGGRKIGVGKNKAGQFSDYITVQAVVAPTEDEQKNIAQLSDDERIAVALALKLELSRAVMGFSTEDIFKGIIVFRRIPITPQLTTEELFNAIWDVEAILNSLFNVSALAWQRHHMHEKRQADESETTIRKGSTGAEEVRGNNDPTFPRPENTTFTAEALTSRIRWTLRERAGTPND